MAIYRGPGGAGDATGDATNASALALAARDEAQASATSASSSATAAANSATAADTSADAAATSATNAAGSATTASTAATNASTYATNAASSATTAASEASDAADSATAAASSASSASTSASTASTQATNAASSASSASTSASTATTKASEAATSATSAASSATSAANSAASIDDASLVHKATAETVSGTKTFTANQIVSVTDNANAALRITQLGTGNALLVEDDTNPDSSPFVIDASGKIIKGYTSTFTGLPATSAEYTQLGSVGFMQNGRYNAAASGPAYNTMKSRSTTVGSWSAAVSNDAIGAYRFWGDDGSAFVEGARIEAVVDGTPGTNDMPGRLVFSTTADGASSPTERMRIDSAGQVSIGGAPTAGVSVYLRKNVTGGTTGYGVAQNVQIQSDVTSTVGLFNSIYSTAASAFTLTNVNHFAAGQGTIGAGSAVTNQYGFSASSTLTGATNNYGFYGNIASGTGRYNFYAAGTADNYFAGNMGVGVTSPSYKVDVSGDVNITGNFYKNGTVVAAGITVGTAVASTSGTSINFTSIPSWVKRITVMFNGVSTNGSSNLLVQLGTSGGIVTSSYASGCWGANTTNTGSSAGLIATGLNGAGRTNYGKMVISSFGSNAWAGIVNIFDTSNNANNGAGVQTNLGGTLDRIRITTVNGTDTFDAGLINILYE